MTTRRKVNISTGLWKYGLAGASCYLVAAVAAFAQTPATSAPVAMTSSHPSSQNVREAQQTLEALKLDPGPADGIFGPRTKAAVKRFQEAEKLTATGTLNAQTRARLAERRREHVVQLQKALKETGHDPGPADGVMGSQTRAAVRRYAAAPAPSSQSGPAEVIERLKRAYDVTLQQSP